MIGRPLSGRSLGGRKLSGYGFSTHGGGGGGSASSVPRIVLYPTTFAEDAGPFLAMLSVVNGSGTYTFTITSDPDGVFALDGDDFEAPSGFDYETKTSHLVTIQADNGVDDPIEQEFTINVTNVLEVTLAELSLDTDEITSGAAEDTVVGALQDVSSGSSLSLTNDAGGRFKLDGTNIVAGATATDYDTDTSHEITVREEHADGNNSPRNTVIEITVLEDAVPITPDLKAFYEFEEASGTRVDSHGSNDLTDNNTVTQTTGVVGNAAQFTAANSEYLSIADNDDIGYSGDFSILCWFNKPLGYADIAQKGDEGFAASEWLIRQEFVDTGYRFVAMVFSNDGDQSAAVVPTNMSADTWYMGLLTYTASTRTVTASLNAGTRASAVLSSAIGRKSGPLYIGRRGSGYMTGATDQSGIWKRVLTTEEEAWLYNSGNGRSYAEVAAGM